MDLITHIVDHVNSGSFSPGGSTPAPFNVPHTGAVGGAGPSTATRIKAEIINRLLLERAALISTLGAVVDNGNWTQATALLKARLDNLDQGITTLATSLQTEAATRTSSDAALTASIANIKSVLLYSAKTSVQFDASETSQSLPLLTPTGGATIAANALKLPANAPSGTYRVVVFGRAVTLAGGTPTANSMLEVILQKNGTQTPLGVSYADFVSSYRFDFTELLSAAPNDEFRLMVRCGTNGGDFIAGCGLSLERI